MPPPQYRHHECCNVERVAKFTAEDHGVKLVHWDKNNIKSFFGYPIHRWREDVVGQEAPHFVLVPPRVTEKRPEEFKL